MNPNQGPDQPRPTNAKNKRKSAKKTNSADWLTNHWTLVVVIGLAFLVAIVITAASLGSRSGKKEVAAPEPRPDSSGPIQVGDLRIDVHQWDCGRMAFEHLENPDEMITVADGNHFCTLGVKVSNLNTEKLRAFDPAGQLIGFNDQDYNYHVVATRDGLGAQTGVRILAAGTGVNADTIAPLVNMVFEIPKDQEGSESPSWRDDAKLRVPIDSTAAEEAYFEIELLDYDKQS